MIEKSCSPQEWAALAQGLADDGRADLATMMMAQGGITRFVDRGVAHTSPFAAGYRTRSVKTSTAPPDVRVAPAPTVAVAATPPAPPSRKVPPAPPPPVELDARGFEEFGDCDADDDVQSLFGAEPGNDVRSEATSLVDERIAERGRLPETTEDGFEQLVPPVEVDDDDANDGDFETRSIPPQFED
jgi:hypothetical protein